MWRAAPIGAKPNRFAPSRPAPRFLADAKIAHRMLDGASPTSPERSCSRSQTDHGGGNYGCTKVRRRRSAAGGRRRGVSARAVFDPCGVVEAERLLAPRIPHLEGMRLGVLDDTKRNANRLLRKTAAGKPGPLQRDAFGLADVVPVVIEHPLSTSSDAKSDRHAAPAIPQCLRIWVVSSAAERTIAIDAMSYS
jgi:hypothetical protein